MREAEQLLEQQLLVKINVTRSEEKGKTDSHFVQKTEQLAFAGFSFMRSEIIYYYYYTKKKKEA